MTFWDRHDHAGLARELSGAQTTCYSGTTLLPGDTADRDEIAGGYEIDPSGDLRFDRSVVDAVEELDARAGDTDFTRDELVRWRTGLRTVLQAHGQLLAPDGERYQIGPFVDSFGRAESLASRASEAWARHDLSGYIDRLELSPALTDALKTVDAEYADPAGVAAVEELADRIAAMEGARDRGEVLRALNNQTPLGTGPRAADLILRAQPLVDTRPDDSRADADSEYDGESAREDLRDLSELAAAELGDDLVAEFARAGQVAGQDGPLTDTLEFGRRTGAAAFDAAVQGIGEIQQRVDEYGGAGPLLAEAMRRYEDPRTAWFRSRMAGRSKGRPTDRWADRPDDRWGDRSTDRWDDHRPVFPPDPGEEERHPWTGPPRGMRRADDRRGGHWHDR